MKMQKLGIGILFIIAVFVREKIVALDHATVAIYVVQGSSGKVLVDENSDLSLVPASCMKVVTTAAALQMLGPQYRFETKLEYDGAVDESKTLRGNIYITGGGDPCLGSDRISGSVSWQEQIRLWADAICLMGIKKIQGSIIGDSSLWEKAMAVPSWSWEDLGNYYGAGASALSFHENLYSLTFQPGRHIGDPTTILRTDMPLSALHLQNEVVTGPEGSGDQACIYGAEFSSTQFIRGTIPLGVSEFSIKGAVPDPATTCAAILEQELITRGVAIEKNRGPFLMKRALIQTTYSPKLQDIVFELNQKSINLYAEHLLKKMGEVVYKEGSTSSGTKAVKEFWRLQGIDLKGFNMADGSGLSRRNLTTAKQFVNILLKARHMDGFSLFLQSLPLREGGIRAKSGGMSLVKGYVGYAGDLVFAILINQGLDANGVKNKIDEFFSQIIALSHLPVDLDLAQVSSSQNTVE